MMTHPTEENLYDLVGIGLGPFNLGLAAMLTKTPDIKAIFLEQKSFFNWHPGLLIEGTTLQVPFLADLVTMADPTNRYSYLNYLHAHQRHYQFYFLERFHIPRKEYNHYCQWVAGQLSSCSFDQQVIQLEWVDAQQPYFKIIACKGSSGVVQVYHSRNLVLGVGSVPYIAEPFRHFTSENVFHTGEFLTYQELCRHTKSIAVIGSGQSAAEVFYHLLLEQDQWGYQLNWLTRSDGFFPMEYSKLGLEHFSPDYIKYFYHLSEMQRHSRLQRQDLLYKGISTNTIADIYDLLYERTVGKQKIPVHLFSQMEVQEMNQLSDERGTYYRLQGIHLEQQQPFVLDSEMVILGTGYQHILPSCIQGLKSIIKWDEKKRYMVQEDYRLVLSQKIKSMIFVQNGEIHTHGVGAPDLGLGAHRNAVIINTLTGREVYPINERNVYQYFGIANTNLT